MAGALYKEVSGCSFGPERFVIGGDEYTYAYIKRVDTNNKGRLGVFGLYLAMVGFLGFMDGAFRAAFVAFPVGIGLLVAGRMFGEKTISIYFDNGKNDRFMTRDRELVSYIKESIDEGLMKKTTRRGA